MDDLKFSSEAAKLWESMEAEFIESVEKVAKFTALSEDPKADMVTTTHVRQAWRKLWPPPLSPKVGLVVHLVGTLGGMLFSTGVGMNLADLAYKTRMIGILFIILGVAAVAISAYFATKR